MIAACSPAWLMFSMARDPVTVAQVQAFVAECFRDGAWRLLVDITEEMSEEPPRHHGTAGNHGADSVSWFDARAFCHWLSARLDSHVRLPTEAEWYLAATGGDPARIWPWGADWDPATERWLANTGESGLDRTLPVGFYPLGASPAGLMDMAGNLWEWCQDVHGKGMRVLRGGSWLLDLDFARSAYRNWHYPFNRLSNIGFRVVCSSSIKEH